MTGLMRKTALAGILLAILVGSFFATLTLLDTRAPPTTADDDPSDAGRLASRSIFDRAGLIEAAVGAGLHSSDRMKGRVDEVSRINDSEVAIKGWLTDPAGEAEPLNVVVFVAGKKKATIQTNGERPDVTTALGLAFGAEKNVGFQASFACRMDEQLVIVGLGPDKQYLYLSSARCP